MKPVFTTENLKVFKVRIPLIKEYGCYVDTYIAWRIDGRDKYGVPTGARFVCACEAYWIPDEDSPGGRLEVSEFISPDFDYKRVMEFLQGLCFHLGEYVFFDNETMEYLHQLVLALSGGSPELDQELAQQFGPPVVPGAAD
jgi:hypothetical protein